VLVVRKVDYCTTVRAVTSVHLLDRLQSMLNTAALLIFWAWRSKHASPINFTGCMFCRESNSGCVLWHVTALTAQCHHTLLTVYAMPPMSAVVVTSTWPTQCRWSFHQLTAFPLAATRTWIGTICSWWSAPHRCCWRTISSLNFKIFCFLSTFYQPYSPVFINLSDDV